VNIAIKIVGLFINSNWFNLFFLFSSPLFIPSPAVRTLDLSTSSIAHFATKFNDRMKAIERAESSSAASATSEVSTSSPVTSKPDGK
jgi:hypothetical protein